MALIKCPECGKDVSSSAISCPHYGYPMKDSNSNHVNTYPKPKSSDWMKKWSERVSRVKITWLLILLSAIIGLVISLVLLIYDKQVVHDMSWTYKEPKIIYIIFTAIFGFIVFLSFIFLLIVLITFTVRTRQYDRYNIVVYTGFKHILIVEDVVQDSGMVNRYMYGQLPNNKQVWVYISPWDGSVKIGVGKDGDEKNLT